MVSYCIIHPDYLVHLGIKELLSQLQNPSFNCLSSYYNCKDAWTAVNELNPPLIFIGIYSNGTEELRIVDWIRRKAKNTHILIIGPVEKTDIARKCLIKGARGFLYAHCPEDEFKIALFTVLNNEVYMPTGFRIHPNLGEVQARKRLPQKLDFELTVREKEILTHIAQGLSNKQISQKLFISDQTVAVHRKNLFRKMGVKNSISLLRVAKEKRMIA